jgi:putative ABC transport system permease protein
VCTLGIAIGGTVTAFSLTDAWLFRPLHFPAADRLVVAFMASAARPKEPAIWMPYRAYLSWKESAHSFSSVSAAFFRGATWRNGSEARSLVGMRVTPEFFATLGVAPLRGRVLTAADAQGPEAVVISYGLWQQELGGADVVGRTIELSDAAYTVVGVMPATFDVRLLDRPEGAAFWTVFRRDDRGYEPGGIAPVTIIARLAGGVTLEAARVEAAAVMRRSEEAYPINFNQTDDSGNRFVVNLSSLQEDNTRTVRSTLLTVLAAAVCLLVIAAINVGVLVLGYGMRRRTEVAVRHALGAGRGRLTRQFLAESLVLCVCSAAVGLALAAAADRAFIAWNPLGTLPANGVSLDLRNVAAATAATLLTTILVGFVPALRISAIGLGATLRSGEGTRATAPAHRAQRVMLAAQIAVSTVLLVCAGLLAKTVIQLRSEPLGFRVEGLSVAEVSLPTSLFTSTASRTAFSDTVERRLRARPGVRSVAAATGPPLIGSDYLPVSLTNADSAATPRMSAPSVTNGYFETLEIPLAAGRRFDTRDTADGLPVVILNVRAATQLFGGPRAALGHRVRLGDQTWREVIGVVGNVRTTFFNTLEWRMDPIVYRPAAQSLDNVVNPQITHLTLWVHVRTTQTLSIADVREAAAAAGPRAAVVSLRQAADLVADATRQPSLRMSLLLWFCGGSLLLAAIGIYGIVAQAVTERLREIAIRLAVGAAPRALVVSLVRTTVATGLVGLAVGILLSLMLTRTLESMLYGVHTGDAASLSLAGLLLLAVTAVAAYVPASRATRTAAAHVLRG